jgi:riboflavin synthase
MFTGIIQSLGTVKTLEGVENALRIRVATGFDDLTLGESVAINGVCLTVAELAPKESGKGLATFFLSPETLMRTSLGALKAESAVNLERAMRAADRLSGHWVQGHVDGLAKLVSVAELGGGSHALRLQLPRNLLPYLVEKGSITLDGISLTVNRLHAPDQFEVAIIPHTWEHTHLHQLSAGAELNVEVDILAKYVERHALAYYERMTQKGPTANA